MSLVGSMRLVTPVVRVMAPSWERRNWEGLREYLESGGR